MTSFWLGLALGLARVHGPADNRLRPGASNEIQELTVEAAKSHERRG